jgi:phosphatidylglycerophosphate synthase
MVLLPKSAGRTARDGVDTLYINRPAGRALAAVGHGFGASPNQLTMISATLTTCALLAIIFIPPAPWVGVPVTMLLVLAYALDSADGPLARFQGTSSAQGEFFDHMVDCAKTVAIHAAVLIHLVRFDESAATPLLAVPLAYQFAAVMIYCGGLLVDSHRRRQSVPTGATTESSTLTRALILLPVDYGVLCLSFLLLGVSEVFVPVYTALAAAHVVYMVAYLAKWYRELGNE